MSFSTMRQPCAAGCFDCSADIVHTPQCPTPLYQTSHLNVTKHYETKYDPFSRTLNGLQSPYLEDNVQHHTSPVTRPHSANSNKVWNEVEIGCPLNCAVCTAGEVHIEESLKKIFMKALTKELKRVERQRAREEEWHATSSTEWEIAEVEKPLIEVHDTEEFMGRPEWVGLKPKWRNPVYLDTEYGNWELPEKYEGVVD